MALIRRNAAVQRIEIGLLHRRRSFALDHVEPGIEHRGKARPCAAESAFDPARSPFLGAFADLVGGEEPDRLGARQWRLRRRSAAMGDPGPSGIFYLGAEMPMRGPGP